MRGVLEYWPGDDGLGCRNGTVSVFEALSFLMFRAGITDASSLGRERRNVVENWLAGGGGNWQGKTESRRVREAFDSEGRGGEYYGYRLGRCS